MVERQLPCRARGRRRDVPSGWVGRRIFEASTRFDSARQPGDANGLSPASRLAPGRANHRLGIV